MSTLYKKEEYHAVVLGALLHDIGKFVQRAQENPREQNHCQWGYEWYTNNLAEKLVGIFSKSKDIIASAINSHHPHTSYISLADALSAGMDRTDIPIEEEEGEPSNTRLISIFSKIHLTSTRGNDKFYKLGVLGSDELEEAFPVDGSKCEKDEYGKLYKKFKEELKNLNFCSTEDAINRIYFLLWKFTWCVPSAVYKTEPDISLFDHLKTTAAIAGCLYRYEKEFAVKPTRDTETFWLVGGDVSGIQNYIMSVLTQQGKVARRLRARSFIIQIISEVYSHLILHRFGLPFCNMLSSAGGNFYILVPALKDTEERLQRIEKEVNEWLYTRFRGELYLPISYVRFSGKELIGHGSNKGFGDILNRLKEESLKKKYNAYHTVIIENGGWRSEKMLMDEVVEGDEAICEGCHKHHVEDVEERLCTLCMADIRIGRRLPKSTYIAFYRNKNLGDANAIVAGDDRYYFELLTQKREDKDAYLLLALNDTEAGYGFKYMANHIPSVEDTGCDLEIHGHEDRNTPALFDCIAELSEGDRLIGYLKADVDNMGKIFREGIKDFSISRFCALSRMVELFFSGYIQKQLASHYRDLYTVFSGGDDFFIIGPWNRVIDFARRMRKEFKRFTGENTDFCFSAGVYLAKPHEPVSFCAESSELYLKKAKIDKDSITIFDKPVKWHELDIIIDDAQRLIHWYHAGVLSRGLMYKFREYGLMAEKSGILEDSDNIDTKHLKFVPLLAYDINRNLTKDNQQDVYNWAKELMVDTSLEAHERLKYLRLTMDYVLTYTRRKERDGEKV